MLGITESEYSIFFYMCYILMQVTAVSFNDTSDQILSGGIDNEIKVMIPTNLLIKLRASFSKVLVIFQTQS